MRNGYKDTPIGMIPERWQCVKLGSEVELIHGYQFRSNDFVENGIPVIKIGNVIGPKLDLNALTFIDPMRFNDFIKYEVKDGDILMSLTGNIGRVIEVNDLPFKVVQNYRVGKFESRSNQSLSKKYIKYLLSSNLVLAQLNKFANQSAQANFGKQDMDKIWIALPNSIEEQSKIASILSTVDDKIDAIDERMTQTQQLKNGLMQRLLTRGIGHTRFKDSPLGEIPESWEVVKFGKMCINITEKYSLPEGRCIDLENVEQGTGRIIGYDEISNKSSTKNHFKINDILFGKLRPYLRKFWLADFEGACTTEFLIFRSNNGYNSIFLFFLVQQDRFVQNAVGKSFGTKMPRTNWRTISELLIAAPSISEQNEIAEMLTLVDEKLYILQEKKTKYEVLKIGLMQKLLTGEIRVRINN